MNFVVAVIAWHADSTTGFWMWNTLMEEYGLRKNYVMGFEGFHDRAKELQEWVKRYNKNVWDQVFVSG